MRDRSPKSGLSAGIVANLLVAGTLAYAALLKAYDSDLYYRSVQEDEYLEWATFWSFLVAAGIALASARGRGGKDWKSAWFLLGLGLFCFLVAMEEISWGQRIVGYRPPDYFLEHNFQQEANLHNVFGTTLRKLVLKAVIVGYGVVLPLAALVPAVKRQLSRAAVVVPPLALAPAFAATYIAYEWYPWEYSGEWVELMLGLGFVFALTPRSPRSSSEARPASELTSRVAVAWLIIVALGVGAAAATRGRRDDRPESVEAARTELESLRRDFLSGRLRTKCGLHKRIYTYVEEYGERFLREGEFSRLRARGLPEARARFFLDPWNSPYWLQDLCTDDESRRRVSVYSLGPNRRQDSLSWEPRGDDLNVVIRRRGL